MAALLDAETAAYPELRRGEIIEGVVVGTDRDGILVDIGAKSEGVVPPNEMHCLQPEGPSKLNQGDKVLVFVLQPESPEGQIILSLDRARGERGWRVLQDYMDQNQAFEGYVTGSNKGGLLVNVEGVNAFVPLSQIVSGPDRSSPEATQKALTDWVGRNITLKVIELNRRRNRAILSERSAVQEKRAAEKERLLLELQEGDVKTGRITSIRDFGIFVDIGGADGLVHLSELSWERTPKSPHDLFKVGDEVPVYVLKVDNETKKIALSVRRAQPERWEEIVSNYREGQTVPGQITKLAPFGAFVRLEGPIEGLIHISELVDRRINHPKEVVDEGDVVPVKIVRIEYDRHRLGLSLRQARDQAESDGWAFSESGRPTKVPQEAMDALGVTELPVKTEAEPETYTQEESAETVAGAIVADAVADAVVADAGATEAVEEAVAEVVVAEAVTEEIVADAQAEEAVAEAVAEEIAEEAIAEVVVAEAVAEEIIGAAPGDADAEALAEEIVEEAIVDAAVAEVVAEEIIEEAIAEEVVADAVAEEIVEEAEAEAVEAEVVAEEIVEEAIAEELTAEAVAEEIVEEAVAEAVATAAEAEEIVEEAEAEVVEAEVVAEEIVEEAIAEELTAEAVAEEIAEEAEAEAVATEETAEAVLEGAAAEVVEAAEVAEEIVEDSVAEASVTENDVTDESAEALNTVETAEES
jgi:small subunit ribosomal protein S1